MVLLQMNAMEQLKDRARLFYRTHDDDSERI